MHMASAFVSHERSKGSERAGFPSCPLISVKKADDFAIVPAIRDSEGE